MWWTKRGDVVIQDSGDFRSSKPMPCLIAAVLFVVACATLSAQTVRVQKISSSQGGFTGVLGDGGGFGSQLASLGDLDGDGIGELAVSAPGPLDQQGRDLGSVWILFLNNDGTVRNDVKVPRANVDAGVATGIGLGALGDQDGDGIPEIAVSSRESFYMVRLNADGTPKGQRAFTFTSGGGVRFAVFQETDKLIAFGAPWADGVYLWRLSIVDGGETFRVAATDDLFDEDQGGGFGFSVAGLELGSDPALAVGAPDASARGRRSGAVFVLQFDEIPVGGSLADVRLRGLVRVDIAPSTLGGLDAGDWFGGSVASIGDMNGDGQDDLVIGAPGDDDGGPDRGAVWVLFLRPDGSVLCGFAISGDEIFVTNKLSHDDQWSLRVFRRTDEAWAHVQDLVPSDLPPPNHQIGSSLSVKGDIALVGTTTTDTTSSGSVYVFGKIDGLWTEIQKLTAPDSSRGFGHSVSTDGEAILVGEPGLAYLYRRQRNSWTHVLTLLAPIDAFCFGCEVATDGDVSIIGAPSTGSNGPNTGAAYVYWALPTSTNQELPGQVPIDLAKNYPNPFRASTTITYHVATPDRVRLDIVDLLGRRVDTIVDGHVNAGWHEISYYAAGLRPVPISTGFARVEPR